MAFMYNPGATTIHPDYSIYHPNDSVSLLFFSVKINELLFNTQHKDFLNKARIQIHYRLLNAEGKNELLDSTTVSYFIQRNSKQDKFVTYIPFRTEKLQKYTLEIMMMDYFRHRANQTFVTFNKSMQNAPQNFFLVNAKTKSPCFTNIVNASDEIKIKYERKQTDVLYCKLYKKNFPMPLPPYSGKRIEPEEFLPDTSWTISYNDSTVLTFPEEGLYFIQADTSLNDGMTLLNFGLHFPQMKKAEEMMLPVRFLTSNKKYKELLAKENMKLALDEFWLNATGNIARSKELIRIFYSRIHMANIFFTSYTQGWKTDRGMIYSIFGPPPTMYKSENMERWIYGDRTNLPALQFTFEKIENPYSDNDYILQRNDNYKTIWFQAIDVWRNGRVFSIGN